jgi:hypothetical protein
MQRFFAAIILILIAMLAICMLLLIVAAGWLLVLDSESRNRLVTEVGVNPAWKEPRFILVQTGIPLVWLGCVIICFLKGKPGCAIVGIAAGAAQEIGLPPIAGYYILNLLYPLWVLPIFGAIRLARPDSYYANWFYRGNLHKYWRAVERFGMIEEYAAMVARNIEVSREFESFLRRKLTPEQRLGGLKTTEAAEFAKLTRMGKGRIHSREDSRTRPQNGRAHCRTERTTEKQEGRLKHPIARGLSLSR